MAPSPEPDECRLHAPILCFRSIFNTLSSMPVFQVVSFLRIRLYVMCLCHPWCDHSLVCDHEYKILIFSHLLLCFPPCIDFHNQRLKYFDICIGFNKK